MASNPGNKNTGGVPPAVAPFNFIPYEPDAVLDDWPQERGHWSGRIVCRLKALKPLLVSGAQTRKSDDDPSECRFTQVDGKPVIPGTSIKGMLRNLVQILSFSAMRPVYKEHLFWRRVNRPGSDYMKKFSGDIQGGFLRKRGAEYFLAKTTVEKRDNNFVEDRSKCRKVSTGGFGKKAVPAYAFLLPSNDAEETSIDREVISDLWEQMTPNQVERYPADERKDMLESSLGLPVFYREENGKVAGLGFCRYFRIKYRFAPHDLAFPDECGAKADALADGTAEEQRLDFATRLFGSTDGKAFKGRVSVASAKMEGKLLKENGVEVILGSPKPTCLPVYLDQASASVTQMQPNNSFDPLKNDINSLNDYNKTSNGKPASRLRGWKMYWHHDVGPISPRNGEGKINKKVLSRLFPLADEATAQIAVHVDRLTDLELGGLLEALQLHPDHAHKLGMGKALGYGSIRLEIDWEQTDIRDMRKLHQLLTDRLAGNTPAFDQEKMEEYKDKFRQAILNKARKRHKEWENIADYNDLPPIKALRNMMNYEQRPKQKSVRYMPLNGDGGDPQNYGRNGVLPPPEKVNPKG